MGRGPEVEARLRELSSRLQKKPKERYQTKVQTSSLELGWPCTSPCATCAK